jgi:carboxyl-terminal processing protease
MTSAANPPQEPLSCFYPLAIATTLLSSLALLNPPSAVALEVVELEQDNPKAVLDEAWQLINREYVDDTFNQTDWLAVRQRLLSREYTSPEAAYAALREELQRLDDPYTRFLDPREYADLSDQTAGEVSGVGLQLQRDEQTRGIYVTGVLEDSPAEMNGLRTGDRILVVDGQSTERMSVNAVSRLLRGEENSHVTLTYSRNNGQPMTVILVRARLEVPTVTYQKLTVNDRQIGYIRLDEFNGHATEQMVAAIEALAEQQVEAFVLDLRGNPGGLLSASIEISRLWLQRGPIVRTLDRSGESAEISANRTSLTDLPLAVLVNGRSASSSEILTGALQDNNRATVVGTTTYGKALVQSLYGLSDGSGLAVTIAHYYTPDGTDISQVGITPDVEVILTDSQQNELVSNPAVLASDLDLQFMQAVRALEPMIQSYQATPASPSQLGRSPQSATP